LGLGILILISLFFDYNIDCNERYYECRVVFVSFVFFVFVCLFL